MEQRDIKVSIVSRGLSHPWSLAFLPDGTMLITERTGRLRVVRNGVLDPNPVAGVPQVLSRGTMAGLMDIAGLLYLLTDEEAAALLKIEPITPPQTAAPARTAEQ